MDRVLSFLTRLRENNTKEWFDLHRSEWKEVRGIFSTFVESLIDGISSFDLSVKGLTVSDCTYRINRDTRFSSDKTPYKTHIGAYIAPNGKKSGYAGYYFHVEPEGGGFIGGSLFSVGIYMPEPVILRSIRDEIFDNGAELMKSIERSNGFSLNHGSKLKRTPKGFATGSEFDDILKLKDIFINKPISTSFLLSENLLENTLREFETTTSFLTILNRAVKFGYEEMM